MSALLIVVAVWLVVAVLVATVLGRVARRADSEELGSTIDWDNAPWGSVDEAVRHD